MSVKYCRRDTVKTRIGLVAVIANVGAAVWKVNIYQVCRKNYVSRRWSRYIDHGLVPGVNTELSYF